MAFLSFANRAARAAAPAVSDASEPGGSSASAGPEPAAPSGSGPAAPAPGPDRGGAAAADRPESLWVGVWAALRQNVPAMVSLAVIAILALVAIITAVAPQVLPADPYAQDLSASFQAPSAVHWFGTDQQGRDIFCRILVGSQISLTVGVLSVAISLVIGVALGAIAGYKGGAVDTVIMRLMDMMLAIPSILLAIAFMAALGRGIDKAIIAIGFVSIPEYARIVRSQVLAVKQADYVAAARVIGDTDAVIIWRHVLPNVDALHHRARHAGHLRGHSGRGGPGLSGPGRAAAGGRMGRHARARPQLHLLRAAHHDLPRPGHHRHRAGVQPAGRWHPRRVRPQSKEEVIGYGVA